MQEINSQSERLSQQLNQVGASALANMMRALFQLSNREQKSKNKQLSVTRKNPSETPSIESAPVSHPNSPETAMDSGFKVTKKDSPNLDISLKQQAEQSIDRLNSLLANRKYFKRDLEVNGTKYSFEKYRGGGIDIQSKDSKLYAKQGTIRFAGDESKLIKDLPDILAEVDRELDLERPKQINNRTEVLYGYDSTNNFIEKTLSQKDAQAILDLMDGKEGTTIKGGENLLIEYGGKKLFETDAKGVVTYSAYDRDPELLSSIKLKDEKGLTDLKNYAKRMASTPDVEAKVSRPDPKAELVPKPPQTATTVAPQSQIGKTLDRAEPTTDVDSKQASSVVYERVLKSEFAKGKPSNRPQRTVDGVKFKLNPQTRKGAGSISIKPSQDADFVKIGEVDKDGNFKPDSKLNDPNVTKALDRVLAARGIDPKPVIETQQLDLATGSKDPEYLPFTRENASNPNPNIGNDSPQIGEDSTSLDPTPATPQGVTVLTRGEKEAVLVPTSRGNSERIQPEPEVSPSR